MQHYPIGTPGEAWQQRDKQTWLNQAKLQRSYQSLVLDPLQELGYDMKVLQYGALSYQSERYPLYLLQSPNWHSDKPAVLITGGVHGYETSGVLGALRFAKHHLGRYLDDFRLVIAPCVSPWAFETVNRWNPHAQDPNRSFSAHSDCEESQLLMSQLSELSCKFLMHIDLHETTDSDESEFRPALAARDGKEFEPCYIPDGFYLVGNQAQPQPEFHQAIIREVAKVTHIAEPDNQGRLYDAQMKQPGVIHYPVENLHLCTGITGAPFSTTTEVYPDSERVDAENCIQAQVTAICAALDFLI